MPVSTGELIQAFAVLADRQDVRVSVKQSAKGAIIAGTCCFIGGMLLGPPGLAIGGVAGGVTAYKMTQGTFRPVSDVIMNDLSDREKEALVNHVRNAVAEFEVTDLALLLPLLLSNVSIQQAVLKTVVTFVTNEMRMSIVD
ncbi:C19orf12 family protein [Megaselia abdita]